MGIINDLATLIGAGAKWDDIKSIAELEKGGNDGVPEQKAEGEGKEDKPDEGRKETPPADDETGKPAENETGKPAENDVELEKARKEIAELKKQVDDLQKANRHKNLDDGSNKSEQDLLNDIMLDMF